MRFEDTESLVSVGDLRNGGGEEGVEVEGDGQREREDARGVLREVRVW